MPSPSKLLRKAVKKTKMASAARGAMRVAHIPYQPGPGALADPRPGLPAALVPSASGGASGSNQIQAENKHPGSAKYRMGSDFTRKGDDFERQIKGYASADSVALGASIDFHVSLEPAGTFTVAVYRLGYYSGKSARLMSTSPKLSGAAQPVPAAAQDRTGRIAVDWPVSWTLPVPADWTSGAYLAVLTKQDGHRNYVPFVVRDDSGAKSDFLVILPTVNWQAYNQWPYDGKTGKNVYHGFVTEEVAKNDPSMKAQFRKAARGYVSHPARAGEVSFNRPQFVDGMPSRFDLEQSFILWAEAMGYDLSYASGLDLHEGRVDSARHKALIFAGHDEYWTTDMRRHAEDAVAAGTSLAFLTANNAYWHVRYDAETRTMACYKSFEDPAVEDFPTSMWRNTEGHALAEQQLMGVQYSGVVHGNLPLIVAEADHWFWAGTGLADGDEIPRILGGEADSLFPDMPRAKTDNQVLLTASPYPRPTIGDVLIQNTSLYQAASGAWVFCAGTFNWPLALGHHGFQDQRVHRATANLLARLGGAETVS